ncbi:hypothetical protein TWF481_006186 [Arthrobotrys musiformis]|uniref:F-box domain-containing protein n=1 Tax=Arthrobotrys musiformis TaxID=47236 RepID=A0AAV9WHC2_9PEZI
MSWLRPYNSNPGGGGRPGRQVVRAKRWTTKFLTRAARMLRIRPGRSKFMNLPLEIIFEILERCDLMSFINLLSTCRQLQSLWKSGAAMGCLLRVLKNGMSMQAWLVYRVLRARRWEAVRARKIEKAQKSQPEKRITEDDLPQDFRINFDKILSSPGLGWPDVDKALNEYPYTIIYGYGYIDVFECRYTVMEDIFYLRRIAEYWVEEYKRDICHGPGFHAQSLEALISKDPERIYNAFYSHWLSEMFEIQEDEMSSSRKYMSYSYHLLAHAESWLRAAKDCQREWRAKDQILSKFESSMHHIAERDLRKMISDGTCPKCPGKICRCSRRRKLIRRRFGPFINLEESENTYKEHRRHWRIYSSKLPSIPEFESTSEDLTLQKVDIAAKAYFQKLCAERRPLW